MRGISWLAENRLAFQEGLCSMEWVSKLINVLSSCFPPPHPLLVVNEVNKHSPDKLHVLTPVLLKTQTVIDLSKDGSVVIFRVQHSRPTRRNVSFTLQYCDGQLKPSERPASNPRRLQDSYFAFSTPSPPVTTTCCQAPFEMPLSCLKTRSPQSVGQEITN